VKKKQLTVKITNNSKVIRVFSTKCEQKQQKNDYGCVNFTILLTFCLTRRDLLLTRSTDKI